MVWSGCVWCTSRLSEAELEWYVEIIDDFHSEVLDGTLTFNGWSIAYVALHDLVAINTYVLSKFLDSFSYLSLIALTSSVSPPQ